MEHRDLQYLHTVVHHLIAEAPVVHRLIAEAPIKHERRVSRSHLRYDSLAYFLDSSGGKRKITDSENARM